ncbi:DUF6456 domain-containing protein [Methylopila henanensis]|uniref:DUF6456 domain-containing protein n=1 Tax=Methylopila henanensis TaxID=873516 RepID=A0ABW4K5I8_9HYPH
MPPSRPVAAGSSVRLEAGERRLLRRVLAAGPGGLAADVVEAAATALARRGLIARRPDGRVVATALGRARAARETGGENGFRAQHQALQRRAVEVDGETAEALVNLDESPLAWLARRKGRDGRPMLAAHEVLAGERLRADFSRGQMSPRVTANWDVAADRPHRGGAGAGADVTDAALAARDRVGRALQAVGPELSGALLDVCCFLKGIEAVERERGWPARGGKLVLGLALASLARHYGYGESAAGPERSGRIVGWPETAGG